MCALFFLYLIFSPQLNVVLHMFIYFVIVIFAVLSDILIRSWIRIRIRVHLKISFFARFLLLLIEGSRSGSVQIITDPDLRGSENWLHRYR
jgi:hypothetical protein